MSQLRARAKKGTKTGGCLGCSWSMTAAVGLAWPGTSATCGTLSLRCLAAEQSLVLPGCGLVSGNITPHKGFAAGC